jgi:MoaA/NifB/PqqE/SkfB family radical SAM enzyme
VPEDSAAREIASRYRVGRGRALEDHRQLREQIQAVATTPELDPVLFLGLDREEPLQAKPSAPYRLDLALTYRIGPGDTMDPLARRRVDRELTTDEWKRILRIAWQAAIPHVTFTGGEPTLREDLVDLVAEAEALGQVAGLLTDGRRFASGELLERLSQAGLDHMLIALDLADPTSMDGLRQAIASDVYTAAHITLTPKTGSVNDTLSRLKDMGLAAVSLSASEASDSLSASLRQARDAAAGLGLELVWDLPVPYSSTHPIQLEIEGTRPGAGWAHVYVEPDGDVLPEQGIDRVLGNLLRDDWATIWSAA